MHCPTSAHSRAHFLKASIHLSVSVSHKKEYGIAANVESLYKAFAVSLYPKIYMTAFKLKIVSSIDGSLVQ